MAGQAGTTAYRQARDALLSLQGEHDRALAEFRWPDVGERFNWAIDWFDQIARGNDACALWIVEEDGSEQKVSFDAMASAPTRSRSGSKASASGAATTCCSCSATRSSCGR